MVKSAVYFFTFSTAQCASRLNTHNFSLTHLAPDISQLVMINVGHWTPGQSASGNSSPRRKEGVQGSDLLHWGGTQCTCDNREQQGQREAVGEGEGRQRCWQQARPTRASECKTRGQLRETGVNCTALGDDRWSAKGDKRRQSTATTGQGQPACQQSPVWYKS